MSRRGLLLGLTRETVPGLGHLPLYYEGGAHGLVVAQPRTGKSTGIGMPNLIRGIDRSVFVCDKGGELARKAALWRAANGSDVYLFDPFRVVEPKYVPSYGGVVSYGKVNGIDFIRKSRSPLTAAFRIAEAFIVEGQHKDAHWGDAAQARFVATCMFVAFDPFLDEYEIPRNMVSVWELLSDPFSEKESLKRMLDSEDKFVADQASVFYKPSKSNTEVASIRNHLRVNCTKTFSEEAILDSMTETNIDFSEMSRRPISGFSVLPGDMYHTHNRYIRYLMSICLSQIESGGLVAHDAQQPATLFLMDEFASFGRFPLVVEAMGRMGGFGVKFLTMVQSFSQLRDNNLYGEGWKAILGNAGVLWYFGGTNDTYTAEEMSKICGDMTVKGITDNMARRPGEADGRSYGDTQRRVYTPDEIMRLPLPYQIIKMSGMNPMRELLYHPSLRDFPDYLAFQAAIDRGDGVNAAISAGRQVQAANDNRHVADNNEPPVAVVQQQRRRMGIGAYLSNAWADVMGQEEPHK